MHVSIIGNMGMPVLSIGSEHTSDHRPILLKWRENVIRLGYPFKFNRIHLADPSFNELISSKWNSIHESEMAPYMPFRVKMDSLRVVTKEWQNHKRSLDKHELEITRRELESLSLSADTCGAQNLGFPPGTQIWAPHGNPKFWASGGNPNFGRRMETPNFGRRMETPKVKHFNWTLLKGKVLTAENLRKRGILGPSICFFCRAEEESSHHLFFHCPFAQSCWTQIVRPIKMEEIFDQLSSLQKNWVKGYPYSKKGKNNITCIWKCIPATLSWQIWLARNNCIFNDKKPNLVRILAKTIALISETISENLVAPPDQSNWHKEEMEWYNKFGINHSNNQLAHPKASKRRTHWKLRGTREEVSQWILDQNRPTLHFDGASKNNPGEAGAGGIIKDSHGKTMVSYEWGLGQMSNNLAEAYSLYLGTLILNRLRIKNPIIVGDSAIVVAAMVARIEFKKEALNNVKLRIEDNVKEMGDTTFKHVLRDNNTEADHYATKASNRQIDQVKENDIIYEKPVP
jgi:ribonuclease HI